jgi:UDP-glucose 4-epimerase
LIDDYDVEAIIHFAGSTIVPESTKNPLGYYGNNTANSRGLIEAAVKGGVRHFIFSSTAAVYGNPVRVPVAEDDPTVPVSPYGWSKLMTEVMLRDASAAHDLTHVALRYFNVAGADPRTSWYRSPPQIASANCCSGRRSLTISMPSSAMRWPGSAISRHGRPPGFARPFRPDSRAGSGPVI